MGDEDDQYIVRGPDLEYQPPTEPLGTILLKRMQEHGDKIVHVSASDGSSETFTDFRRRSICIAQNMRSHSLGKGDNISICSRNQMNAFATATAAVLIGAPVNGLDSVLTISDLKYILNLIQPKAVFCEVEGLQGIEEAISDIELTTLIVVYDDEDSAHVRFSEFLVEKKAPEVFKPVEIEDLKEAIALIICTSGSTGYPKSVMLCHFNLIALYQNSYDKLKKFKCSYESRMFSFATLYWIGGIHTLMHCLYCGITRVFTTKPFSEKVALEIFQNYKPTIVSLPSSMVTRLVKHSEIGKYDLSSITDLTLVGTKSSAEICTKMNDLLPNGVVRNSFGMTEGISTLARTENGSTNFHAIGKLSEGVSAKIVNVNNRKILGRNEPGELLIKFDFMMNGYYKNPKETANIIDEDGWLHTGDLCYFNEEAELFYIERICDMLKYQNISISPSVVEDELLKHPAVLDCCVVGVPHEEYGDILVAFVILVKGVKVTEEELIDFVADRVTEAEQLRGGVIILQHMPVLSSGKIKRKYLKGEALKAKERIFTKIV